MVITKSANPRDHLLGPSVRRQKMDVVNELNFFCSSESEFKLAKRTENKI